MKENALNWVLPHKNIAGTDYYEGDVVLVLRDSESEDGDEQGGTIYDIESSGRVFIDYGGVVSLLHDEDQIRKAPEEIRESLALKLEQESQELRERWERATAPIRKVLQRHRDEENQPLAKRILRFLNPLSDY